MYKILFNLVGTPHPALQECKKVQQPISVEIIDGKLKLFNKYFFTNLNIFQLGWEVNLDNEIVSNGTIENLDVKVINIYINF